MKRFLACIMLVGAGSSLAGEGTPRLARDLLTGGDPAGAAVEYRRLALAADAPAEQAGWYWASAYAYGQAGAWPDAERMLDRVEDRDPGLSGASSWLRGEAAWARRDFRESGFFFDSVGRSPAAEPGLRRAAGRRLAAAHVQQGDPAAARAALDDVDQAGAAAVAEFAAGNDRRPALGGWLGLVPGLGYAYAGEYANATRSLILNGLFIWGLASTAEEEQWGAFAALAFFEVTWYSGSIYGGVDASHRYNERRRQRAVESITAGAVVTPDYEALPAVKLKVAF